jgi:hypothetical protein
MTIEREERPGRSDDKASSGRDLRLSLCVLGLLVAFALSGLAWDENWRKLLRVLIGFAAYVIALLSALSVYSLLVKKRAPFPFWAFALAGAVAELSSGWLRPTARGIVDMPTAIAAAFLIGGLHWLALRTWRPLHDRIILPKQSRAA